MFAQVSTVAFLGIDARPVDVQVQIGPGLPSFSIVGLPDKAVAESRERVRAALCSIGLGLPAKRITVNLAPADLPKEGSHYDLPIAVGLMVASGAMPGDEVADYAVIGELGLDGSVAAVTGCLPAAIGANAMGKGLICPYACGPEAAWASPDMAILAPPHLLVLANHFKGLTCLPRPNPELDTGQPETLDLRDVRGQEMAKRAIEIAAAGGHHLLMTGPPGAGKSMLAQRLPGLLPPLSPQEMLEISMIQSMAGQLGGGRLSRVRPFRTPHHSASMAALVGGGSRPRPGEVALAHHGVLFLDELPEFAPQVIDALRQPLESGAIVIARANHRISYPTRIQLVAAMNPCRCGHAGEPGFSCRQGQNCKERYLSRISGPILDRIDIRITVPSVTAADLAQPPARDGSREVGARVEAARLRQFERYDAIAPGTRTNAECPPSLLDEVATPDAAGQKLLQEAALKFGMSARGYHRSLRLARTLADLDGEARVRHLHVAEALAYRGGGIGGLGENARPPLQIESSLAAPF
ncbi:MULTISPECIES: YifB family Mg chelatase-like AAA ATPase [Rhodomicrobium]|uniref:YifB family Mg chelatase-like AAA ATPase n=1 Tax=Rhodomicrobium TaxID=1068 RepID=UPI000B4BFFAA|nr:MULTISPECIES: YifB family Mg chelatase-like AAA ATPase [Rhodomicrobium]